MIFRIEPSGNMQEAFNYERLLFYIILSIPEVLFITVLALFTYPMNYHLHIVGHVTFG